VPSTKSSRSIILRLEANAIRRSIATFLGQEPSRAIIAVTFLGESNHCFRIEMSACSICSQSLPLVDSIASDAIQLSQRNVYAELGVDAPG
jgi:hypothetical protein